MAPPLPAVAGVEHHHVQAGDVRLHYAEAGSGDPLVLLHGWPQHWYMWRRVIPLLSGQYRLICPDLRGFGWSDAPDSSYEKEELAGDVLALLDKLGLGKVHLVGHDWGGLVGFLLCLRAPARVGRFLALSIIHPWLRHSPPSLRGVLAALAYQPLIAAPLVGPLAQRRTPFVDAVFAASGGERIWSAEERRAFVDTFKEPARAEAASRVYRTFLARELPAMLRGRYQGSRLTVPTRLVVGRGDPVIDEARVANWEDHADQMEVEFVEGGHFLPEEKPEMVAERALSLFGEGPAK